MLAIVTVRNQITHTRRPIFDPLDLLANNVEEFRAVRDTILVSFNITPERGTKNVRTEIALSVLAYNLTRVINILGITPLIQAIRV